MSCKELSLPEKLLCENSLKESLSIEGSESETESVTHKNTVKGVFFMIASALSFGTLGFGVKLTYQNCPNIGVLDMLFIRSTFMIIAYYIYARMVRVNLLDISKSNSGILLLRVIFGVYAMGSVFQSMHYLPASISFTIFNVNPIFVIILAYFVLNEEITKLKFSCGLGAFIGIAIVGLGRKGDQQANNQFIGIVLAGTSGISASLAYVGMRKINTQVHFLFSPFYLSVGSLVVPLIAYGFFENSIHPNSYDLKSVSFGLMNGVLAFLAQLFLSIAYKNATASTISPIMYLNSGLNLITDLVVFNYEFYLTDFVGGIFTFVGVILPVVWVVGKRKV